MSSLGFEGSHRQSDVVLEKHVMVPMRDGVRLATDIYRPSRAGKPVEGHFPSVLERTPYGKTGLRLHLLGKYFASRGYVTVIQDIRGRHASEGEFGGLYRRKQEALDGYDCLEWISHQSWSDGQVGTIGFSASGAKSQALATMRPPQLKAQFIIDSGYNYHTRARRNHGAYVLGIHLPWKFYHAWTGKEAAADPLIKKELEEAYFGVKEWFQRLPLRRGASPLRHVPAYEQWYFDEITRGDYDEFWKNVSSNLEEDIDRYADIPIYLLTSWYGHHPWANVTKYAEFTKRHRSPVKLLIGCWVHGFGWMQETWAGEVDFGLDAALGNPNALALRWFDHWLKGMDTGIMEEPPIKLFVMGGGDGSRNEDRRMSHGGRWRFEKEWPLARTRFVPYYLHAGGSLSPEPPGADDPLSSFIFDPTDPVPTLGGNVMCLEEWGVPNLLLGGAYDQRGRERLFFCKDPLPLAQRSDILVFQTAPLAQDVEVTGPLAVRLWVSSSAVDTDFTAKLIDVCPPNQDYPDGYAMNLADSILRMRYRNSREKAEMMIPGEIYEILIEPQPTSNLFKAGHRIRLDISSSNFPQFDVNPNTGGPLGMERKMVVAHNTVYHDAEHPSHVVLPIVPRRLQL